MGETTVVDPVPYDGWLIFCSNPAHVSACRIPSRHTVVQLTRARWTQLLEVNARFNDYPYVSDSVQWGVPDHWDYVDDSGRGDCEDYALAKQRALARLGWPPGSLRIATLTYPADEFRGPLIGHAVLTVDTDRGTYVLDNRYNQVLPWDSPITWYYRWIERRGWGTRSWVLIDSPPRTR